MKPVYISYEENPALEKLSLRDIWDMSRDQLIRYFSQIGFSDTELSRMHNLTRARIGQIRKGK